MTTRLGFAAVALLILSGCASVTMHAAPPLKPTDGTAVVSFVRPAILVGDGVSFDVWHGSEYLGSLNAGSRIQIQLPPGRHLFLANAENWSYATADLRAGKEYFVKANTFPGVIHGRVALGVVKRDDPRIASLRALPSRSASEEDRREMNEKKAAHIGQALADWSAGRVSSFARVTPEDGVDEDVRH
ncbi:MAG: hypothetical protein HY856_04375 [Burkholderiales bacterium]|nr:hypothetical protein [Burkholderiales bacterium]